jgi:hypothetical protein
MNSLKIIWIIISSMVLPIVCSSTEAQLNPLQERTQSFLKQRKRQKDLLIASVNKMLDLNARLPSSEISIRTPLKPLTSGKKSKSFDATIKERLEKQKKLKSQLAQINTDFECAVSLASLSPDQAQTTPIDPPAFSLNSDQFAVVKAPAQINQRLSEQAKIKATMHLKTKTESNKRKNVPRSPEQPWKKARVTPDAEEKQNSQVSLSSKKKQNKKKKRA